ncbi:MAG: FAD-dependent oxidoreductase [Myxococcota bacterium]|nr:FAD-dependent oxidoreductase [Myxococcota bacterium]
MARQHCNSETKIVIVGGVAGGASAAARARRVNQQARIILLEKGPFVSYANCGLPFHLSGEIEKREDLFVASVERLKKRFDIDVRVQSEVVSINRIDRFVTVQDAVSGKAYEETFDKLILACGAEAIAPPLPGIDATGVFHLKTVGDMDRIITYIERENPSSAAVVGGGFIGLEAAEALHRRELEVTVIEAADQLLGPWDPDMAGQVEQHLLDEMFVEVVKSDPIAAIETKDGSVCSVETRSGEKIDADLVILALGVRPLSALARDAGLKCSEQGLIAVDARQQTSDENIFAVGDAVQSTCRITGQPTWLPLAGPANRQGRVAGTNAAGGEDAFPGTIGTSIVRVGKITAGRTGLSERQAQAAGLDYITALISGKSHAGYYPGARDVQLKYIVETPSGRLLGAQAVGRDGVDKRIDVLATAIIGKMTVADILHLELAYAPPFGAAKDPINMAAMVAQNILDQTTEVVSWEALYEESPTPLILDVRSEEERKTVYVKNSELMPIDDLRERVSTLDPDRPTRVYCRIGQRGYFAEQFLKAAGFRDVKNIAGGWRAIWGDHREDGLIGQEPEPQD